MPLLGSLADGDRALDDAELLAAHVAGDRGAFGVLYHRHRQMVFGAVWSVLRHHQDAEDAVQDAFARAAQHAGRFRGEATVTTWLRRIAVNTALSHLANRRRAAEPVDPTHALLSAGAGAAAGADEAALVEDVLRRLSSRLRESFFLHALHGFTAAELAALLGVPRDTVLSRVRRARATLAGSTRPPGTARPR